MSGAEAVELIKVAGGCLCVEERSENTSMKRLAYEGRLGNPSWGIVSKKGKAGSWESCFQFVVVQGGGTTVIS